MLVWEPRAASGLAILFARRKVTTRRAWQMEAFHAMGVMRGEELGLERTAP